MSGTPIKPNFNSNMSDDEMLDFGDDFDLELDTVDNNENTTDNSDIKLDDNIAKKDVANNEDEEIDLDFEIEDNMTVDDSNIPEEEVQVEEEIMIEDAIPIEVEEAPAQPIEVQPKPNNQPVRPNNQQARPKGQPVRPNNQQARPNNQPVKQNNKNTEQNNRQEIQNKQQAKKGKLSFGNEKTVRTSKQSDREREQLAKVKTTKNKKINKTIIIALAACGSVLLIIIIITLININKNKSNQKIQIVTEAPVISSKSEAEKNMQNTENALTSSLDTELQHDDKQEKTDTKVLDDNDVTNKTAQTKIEWPTTVKFEDHKDIDPVKVDLTGNDNKEQDKQDTTQYKQGEEADINLKVNTKLPDDDSYTDHTTHLLVKYANTVTGYDKVLEYINEYNTTSTTNVVLPDKDNFYANSETNELVMFEYELTIPKDFLTSDEKGVDACIQPELTLDVKGTYKDESLVTDKYTFKAPKVTDISTTGKEFKVGETYTYRYITTIPEEADENVYKLSLNIKTSDDNVNTIFSGAKIPKISYVPTISENTSDEIVEE